jgi:hypothetical protein
MIRIQEDGTYLVAGIAVETAEQAAEIELAIANAKSPMYRLRRLAELLGNGEVSRRLGISNKQVLAIVAGTTTRVNSATAEAVDELWDEYWKQELSMALASIERIKREYFGA